MKKRLSFLFHFLGSVHFALLLITLVTLCVIAGTLIEAATDSHRNAARFTYDSPAFITLLWLFFINILFAALRRWPFQRRHLPFLTVHLGLLMILGGSLVKSYVGTQGTMTVLEGGVTDQIFLDKTAVLHLERKTNIPFQTENMELELPTTWGGNLLADLADQRSPMQRLLGQEAAALPFAELRLSLKSYAPHSVERLQFWIKDRFASVSGQPPIPLQTFEHSLPAPMRTTFPETASLEWQLYAFEEGDTDAIIRASYVEGAILNLVDPASGRTIVSLPLAQAVTGPIPIAGGECSARLFLTRGPDGHFTHPSLQIEIQDFAESTQETIAVPLDGPLACLPFRDHHTYLGSPRFDVRIQRTATLLFLEETQGDNTVVAIDPYGRIFAQAFRQDTISQLFVYDDGFGGYSTQLSLPGWPFLEDPRRVARLQRDVLADQLEQVLASTPVLSPPLQLLQRACQESNADLVTATIAFLEQWDRCGTWLYPDVALSHRMLPPVIGRINWREHPRLYKAAQWIAQLQTQLLSEAEQEEKNQGHHLLSTLRRIGWPLVDHLEKELDLSQPHTAQLLTALGQQVIAVVDQLPDIKSQEPLTIPQSALLLSALMRSFGLHYRSLISEELPIPDNASTPPSLECPVTRVYQPLPPIAKLEDQRPLIRVHVATSDGFEQDVDLAFDPFGQGLKWPILGGRYLARFQPRFTSIPYQVHVRHSEQINYPSTGQPYSYEANIAVHGATVANTQLSMNHVHETWDGYRFYLANLTPGDESSAKRVQLVINQDPAKYWLTYPGGLFVSLGMLGLFWFRPRAR